MRHDAIAKQGGSITWWHYAKNALSDPLNDALNDALNEVLVNALINARPNSTSIQYLYYAADILARI